MACKYPSVKEKELLRKLIPFDQIRVSQSGGGDHSLKQKGAAHALAIMTVLGGAGAFGLFTYIGYGYLVRSALNMANVDKYVAMGTQMFKDFETICSTGPQRVALAVMKEQGTVPLDCHDYDKWVLANSKTFYNFMSKNYQIIAGGAAPAFVAGSAFYFKMVKFWLSLFDYVSNKKCPTKAAVSPSSPPPANGDCCCENKSNGQACSRKRMPGSQVCWQHAKNCSSSNNRAGCALPVRKSPARKTRARSTRRK